MESFSGELTANQIATNASGSSLKEWEVRVESANVKAAQAVESLRQMVEAIGSQFLANFSSGAEAVTALGQVMEGVVEGGGLEPLFNALRPLFAEFTATLQQIAANLPAAFEQVALQHDSAVAWNNLARLRLAQGQMPEAREAARRALARAAQAEPAWLPAAQATQQALDRADRPAGPVPSPQQPAPAR
jgi:hypothetical protein